MIYIVYTIHVLICLFLILVVLLQQGSGADLSVFGGGGTQTAFGARSATSLLHKLTVGGFVAFILTTIAIGFLKTGGSGSVMSDVEQSAPAEAVEEAADTAPPTAVEGDSAGAEAPDESFDAEGIDADSSVEGAADEEDGGT
ncbi:MAG: preprotein translocase subunit SecG [Thermoanaerobaculia bacterium]